MRQMDVPEEMRVELDFQDEKVPVSAKVLQPVVFREGDSFCCVLGPDPTEGVFGCGKTPEEALKDWDAPLTPTLTSQARGFYCKSLSQ